MLLELIPIILFFVAYKLYDIFIATIVLMFSFSLQIIYQYFKNKKVEPITYVSFILVIIFGIFTLYFHNEHFIQWKVTILNLMLALVLLLSNIIFKKNLIKILIGDKLQVKDQNTWNVLNYIWGFFFLFIALINSVIVLYFSLDFWMNFKLFGFFGITIIFLLCQGLYLYNKVKEQKD